MSERPRYRVYDVNAETAHFRWAVVDMVHDKVVTVHDRRDDAALNAEALNAIDARRRVA